MAACLIEDARRATPIYCPTTNPMERALSASPAETSTSSPTPFADSLRCSLNFPISNKRKRQTSFSETGSTNDEETGNSCQFPAVSINKTNDRKNHVLLSNGFSSDIILLVPKTPTRPSSLFLPNSTTSSRPLSLFRTCASHPPTSPSLHDDQSRSPVKFTSLLELSSPQAKRRRPETLRFTAARPVIVTSTTPPSTAPRLISPTELADKIRADVPLVLFDCGSPFRHSEHRIRNAVLLRVADKLSRKRWKSHGRKQSNITSNLLNESSFIVLYGDQDHRRRACANAVADQLSPALECACEEIRRCQSNHLLAPILILNCSFDQFLDLYPHLCESLQPRSCPSSPMNHSEQSSPPRTAPPVSHSSVQTTLATNQIDIDSHPMTHIIDGLFIGSESNAKNLEELAAEQIRCIVNVTSHVPLYHSDQFQYCHLPADDTQKQNLLEYFDQAYTFIRNAIENNEKVLVHCVAGISRSPAIVIGFLMKHAKMSMNDAYEFVKRKRTIVSPNLNFMGQLLEYEKTLKQCK